MQESLQQNLQQIAKIAQQLEEQELNHAQNLHQQSQNAGGVVIGPQQIEMSHQERDGAFQLQQIQQLVKECEQQLKS